eukprot:2209846-Amphidinium_carterae.1
MALSWLELGCTSSDTSEASLGRMRSISSEQAVFDEQGETLHKGTRSTSSPSDSVVVNVSATSLSAQSTSLLTHMPWQPSIPTTTHYARPRWTLD